MRVVIVDGRFPSFDLELQAARDCGAELAVNQCSTPSEVADAVRGADIALVQFAPFRGDAFAAMNDGATVIRYGVGYDNIDVSAGYRRGAKLGFIPDYCTDEVADHTAAMILASLRRILPADRSVREGRWSAVAVMKPLPAFADTTIGFLGLGRIGVAVQARLQPFGFRFLAHDPAVESAAEIAAPVALCGLDELFTASDAITLHVPSTAKTRHIVNEARLRVMKPNAVIINTARGDLVDNAALAEALSESWIGGAALDVFESEPLPMDHPLRSAPNLLLSPHAAWYSDTAMERLQSLAAADIRRACQRLDPRRPIPH
jgi:D-3-phosphoglycerate dehydrogenase